MEQRMIDANALRERLLVLRCNITNVQSISAIFDICITEVSNAPTVNTISIEKQYFIKGFKEGCEYGKKCYERPQGEWIKWNFKTFGAMGDWEYKCSNCEKVYGGEYNFCPNCGADMRVKGEKE